MDRRGRGDRDGVGSATSRLFFDEEEIGTDEMYTYGLSDPVVLKLPPPASSSNNNESNGDKQKDITKTRMAGIEQAKDRAQITSATAMSIVHVALLKNVLDASSEGDKYYTYRLAFIITALVLQVIAGLIALYIALLRNYYSEYKDDFLHDCCKTCCPWSIRRKEPKKPVKSFKKETTSSTVLHQPLRTEQKKEKKTEEERTGCCPFECTTKTYADFEYEVLNMYEDLTEDVIWSQVDNANFEDDITWQYENIEILTREIEKFDHLEVKDEVAKAENEENKKKLKVAKEKAKETELRNRRAKSLRAKGIVMEGHVEKIHQQRVMKRATFWQNSLNMIFYTVFVLNAIIAGIGLANPTIPVAADGIVTPAAVNITN